MKIKKVEEEIMKIIPKVEEKIAYRIVRRMVDIIHEEIYPPESMFRKEFIEEVKEVLKEAKAGKLHEMKEFEKIVKEKWPIRLYLPSKFLDDTKKLKGELKQRLEKSVRKIIKNPYFGKPLRYVLKGTRRVHIGPFVLIYEIIEKEEKVIFLKFANHDEAYK